MAQNVRIGLATAKRLGQEGCKVVVSSRKQENVDSAVEYLTKEGIEASGTTANQRIKEHREKLLQFVCEKYGGFDHVFISAGVNPHHGNLLSSFDTNLRSNFQFIQECAPHLEKRGGGAIVTNSSAGVYGAYNALVGRDLQLYALSKLCLIAMSQQLAPTLFDKKIRLNCVAPGGIQTPFSGGVNSKYLEQYWDLIGIDGETSLQARFGNPDEVASVVAFLLSEDASYMAGNIVVPTGGYGHGRFL